MKVALNGKTISNCEECEQRVHKLPMGFVCTQVNDRAAQNEGFPVWCPLEDKQADPQEDLLDRDKLLTKIADLLDNDAGESAILDVVLIDLGMQTTPTNLPPQPWKPKGDDRVIDGEDETIIVCRYYDEDMVDAIIRLVTVAPQLLIICYRLARWSGKKMDVLNDIIADAKDVIENMEGASG